MDINIKELNDSDTNILVAPPSVLLVLARAIDEGLLNLSLDKVVSVAEVLETEDAVRFKKVFSVDVIHQAYQCTEGFLGFTCEHGTIHINEDMVKIEEETIDENRFIPLVTDFTRRSQPIVRYRLNDVLVKRPTPCPCGSHFLAIDKIEGREDDVFVFKKIEGGGEVKIFPDIVRRCIIYVEGITNYQVIQNESLDIEVKLEYGRGVSRTDVQDKVREEFDKVAKRLDFVIPQIGFGIYEHTTDVKLKRVKKL